MHNKWFLFHLNIDHSRDKKDEITWEILLRMDKNQKDNNDNKSYNKDNTVYFSQP